MIDRAEATEIRETYVLSIAMCGSNPPPATIDSTT
jgi:hypothetical protein